MELTTRFAAKRVVSSISQSHFRLVLDILPAFAGNSATVSVTVCYYSRRIFAGVFPQPT